MSMSRLGRTRRRVSPSAPSVEPVDEERLCVPPAVEKRSSIPTRTLMPAQSAVLAPARRSLPAHATSHMPTSSQARRIHVGRSRLVESSISRGGVPIAKAWYGRTVSGTSPGGDTTKRANLPHHAQTLRVRQLALGTAVVAMWRTRPNSDN